MPNVDQSSRLESQLPYSKGLVAGIMNFLKQNLSIVLPATVISFDSSKNIVTCTIDNPLFSDLQIQAPLIQNFANLNLQKGQSIVLAQTITEPLNPNARNYFDKGNWVVLSAFDLDGVSISIPDLEIERVSGTSLTIGNIVIDDSGITIGGSNGVVITSSGITIGGKDWANHMHIAGTLVAPNGPVSGTTGIVV